MKFIKENWKKLVLLFYLFITPIFTLSAATDPSPSGGDGKILNPLASTGVDTVPKFIEILLNGALKVGIPIVALAVIYVGFLFVAARGNENKLTEAKSAFTWTIIGAGILLGAWAIAKLISATVLAL